jgi:hypothetical protein
MILVIDLWDRGKNTSAVKKVCVSSVFSKFFQTSKEQTTLTAEKK